MISSLIRLLKKDRTAWKFTEPYLPDTNLSPNLSILYDVETLSRLLISRLIINVSCWWVIGT